MSGSASDSMIASCSESEKLKSQSESEQSESESERASTESDADQAPGGSTSAQEKASRADASATVGPAPPPEQDAESAEKPTKKRNRNSDKWELLHEWDGAQHTEDMIQRELLAIVTDINVAAGLDKFPVHKDRTEGLRVLTYNTSWAISRGLITKILYDCPL